MATANVSRGGAFFSAPRTPSVGVRVEVTLELPDGTVVMLSGECVHVRTPEQARARGLAPGFGLRFDLAAAGDLAKLEAMAQEAGVPVEVHDDALREGREAPEPRAAATPLPEAPAVQLLRRRQ